MGKVISDRIIGNEVVRRIIEKIWRVGKPLEFHELRSNSFIITLANPGDKNSVMEGKPWLFDNYLFVLKMFNEITQSHKMCFKQEEFWVQIHNSPLACMNKSIGEHIGSTIGKVVDVDVRDDGLRWGSCLRVRVECDLRKVVAQGRIVHLQGRNMWVPLTRNCERCVLDADISFIYHKGVQEM